MSIFLLQSGVFCAIFMFSEIVLCVPLKDFFEIAVFILILLIKQLYMHVQKSNRFEH